MGSHAHHGRSSHRPRSTPMLTRSLRRSRPTMPQMSRAKPTQPTTKTPWCPMHIRSTCRRRRRHSMRLTCYVVSSAPVVKAKTASTTWLVATADKYFAFGVRNRGASRTSFHLCLADNKICRVRIEQAKCVSTLFPSHALSRSGRVDREEVSFFCIFIVVHPEERTLPQTVVMDVTK